MYNIQHAWCTFRLLSEYWFEIINYNTHYIHMCYTCLACESKMASILYLIVGSSVGCPLFPYLKIVACPRSCLLSCPLYLHMEVVGSLICMAKFPLTAHSTAYWAAYCFQPMGSPLRWPHAAQGQQNGLLPCFFRIDRFSHDVSLTEDKRQKYAKPWLDAYCFDHDFSPNLLE